MQAISYTSLRNHLADILDQVNENHSTVLITRRNGKPAVLMSLEDFNSYQETAHLMSNHANLSRLQHAISEIENGKSKQHGIIDK